MIVLTPWQRKALLEKQISTVLVPFHAGEYRLFDEALAPKAIVTRRGRELIRLGEYVQAQGPDGLWLYIIAAERRTPGVDLTPDRLQKAGYGGDGVDPQRHFAADMLRKYGLRRIMVVWELHVLNVKEEK